ncbi:MAG: ORF6N domain-containing protein [Saprospiraceae bacterium]
MMKEDRFTIEKIQTVILPLRNQRVMLDRDLAILYGLETKRLNEQVKRNIDRFPGDFMFQLSQQEKDWVVANCDHLSGLKYSPTLPYAFTEHGAVMLASVLNSKQAIATSINVVRAFVHLRNLLTSHKDLARKIKEL